MQENTVIKAFHNRFPYFINQNKIDYVKAYNGYVIIIADGKKFRSDESLSSITSKLNPNLFFRINKSYTINLNKLSNYRDHSILIQEEKIRIARSKYKTFDHILMSLD